MREPLHPPPKSAPEVYMYTLLHRHYQHPSASAETPQTTPFHIDIFYISHHDRDLQPRKASLYFFTRKVSTVIFIEEGFKVLS